MPLRLLFLLSLFFPCSIAAQKQVCVIDADTQQPIGNVVITNTQTGKILGVTRENGLYTVEPQTQRLSFSHLSYLPLQAQPADTIRMRPHNYPLSSPQVTAQAADYYRLRAVVRNYQYIDSLPVNFVDAIIDFYVNGKGNKLEYQIIKLDAYRDK